MMLHREAAAAMVAVMRAAVVRLAAENKLWMTEFSTPECRIKCSFDECSDSSIVNLPPTKRCISFLLPPVKNYRRETKSSAI